MEWNVGKARYRAVRDDAEWCGFRIEVRVRQTWQRIDATIELMANAISQHLK